MPTLAICGCGRIVEHHLQALAAAERGFRVAALVDPDPVRRRVVSAQCVALSLADADAPPAEYASLNEAQVLPLPEIVFIAVPHDLHEDLACQALASGVHVVIEKPLAPTLAGCDAIAKAAAAAPGLLFVAEQSPYWQEVAECKRLLPEIGTVVSIAATYYESMRENATSGQDEAGGLGWRKSLARCGGGVVIDGGLHWLRPMRHLCGDVAAVVGTTANVVPSLGLEGETLAHALLRFESGVVGTFSAIFLDGAPMAHDACPFLRVTGTAGELVVSGEGLRPGGGGLRVYTAASPGGREVFADKAWCGPTSGFKGLWAAIATAVAEGDREAARAMAAEARADVAVVLGLYESAGSGQWVSMR